MPSRLADKSLRVIIVEDEAPARQKLKMQLAQIEGIELIAESDDATAAINEINSLKPDVVLLDIELGALNGFDVLDAISHPCHVVFTTAYNEYAVQAFENRALDYLLKPFNLARLKEAFSRVQARLETRAETRVQDETSSLVPLLNECLISKVGDKMRVLRFDDIAYITTSNGICSAFDKNGEHALEGSLDSLSEQVPSCYLRVHRNCIVNTKQICQIDKWQNGCYLLRFKLIPNKVTTSRSGASALKSAFKL